MRVRVRQMSKHFRPGGTGLRDLLSPAPSMRLALQNMDFEIAAGSITGILGANGSGKSTLLRILARTTRPSAGSFTVDGKLVAVLSTGGVLHSDLLVFEALHLHAALCGQREPLRREDIERLLAFAELTALRSTPVHELSLGTRVRLLVAVALFSDWDVLLVDEVFSSLDLPFRWKCEAVVRDKVAEGASLLVVSHDWEWVGRFCHQALCLEAGVLIDRGPATEVVSRRLNHLSSLKSPPLESSDVGLEQKRFTELAQSSEERGPADRV